MKKVVMFPARDLVHNCELYPRNDVDRSHVNNLKRAREAGAELPPIIVARESLTIVDGVHRREAYLAHGGEDVLIPVIFKDYKDDAELFLDAVKYNSRHGLRLQRQDEIRVTIIAQELGIAPKEVAVALNITEPRQEELSVRTVISSETKKPVPARQTVPEELRGKELTPQQLKAMDEGPGIRTSQVVSQLYNLIASGLYDKSDPSLIGKLHELADLIKRVVPTEAEPSGDAA